jgi:hypothetical protein
MDNPQDHDPLRGALGALAASRSARAAPRPHLGSPDPDARCGPGDTATISPSGYLRLGGRLDGLINTGGSRGYPGEVEGAIGKIQAITAAMVTGEPRPGGARRSPPASCRPTRAWPSRSGIGPGLTMRNRLCPAAPPRLVPCNPANRDRHKEEPEMLLRPVPASGSRQADASGVGAVLFAAAGPSPGTSIPCSDAADGRDQLTHRGHAPGVTSWR